MRKPPLQDIIVKNRDVPMRGGVSASRQHSDVVREDHSRQKNYTDRKANFSNGERIENTHHESDSFPNRAERRPGVGLSNRGDRFNARGRGSLKWLSIALGVGLVVVISSVGLSLLFAGATITVYPKQDTVIVDAIFSIDTADATQGVFPIERVSVEKVQNETIVALGEEEVEERAVGKITIYNEFSEMPQRIIPRTRFRSSTGLVYRVSEAVEIPGMRPDGTPGTIEVTVRAEEPGEAHNITDTETFTLPGYEEAGLPQAEKIYAKTSGDISGGFKGIRRTVGEDDRRNAVQNLETKLRDELLADAFSESNTPQNFQLYKDAIFFEFETLPDVLVGTEQVTVGVKGTLHGILFPKDAFSKKVAELTLSAYDGSPIRLENIHELSVSVSPTSDADENQQPWNVTSYRVAVQGKAHFIWEFDEKSLARDFAGKDKDILNLPSGSGVMNTYPGIDRLEASVRPFWKRTFPESSEDIMVVTELDD